MAGTPNFPRPRPSSYSLFTWVTFKHTFLDDRFNFIFNRLSPPAGLLSFRQKQKKIRSMQVTATLSRVIFGIFRNLQGIFLMLLLFAVTSCSDPKFEGSWDFEFAIGEEPITGILKLESANGAYQGPYQFLPAGKDRTSESNGCP